MKPDLDIRAAAPTPPIASPARFWPWVALIAAAAMIVYWWVSRAPIAEWRFPDPDDQMRLQGMRDLLAGQSWFDMTQHRMNWPAGAPMHWSRLIDIPLLVVSLALRPFVGAAAAEAATVVIVPLMTLGCAIAAAAALGRRLLGRIGGLCAAAMLPFSMGALHQLRPMRIDHHGWQLVIGLMLMIAVLDRNPVRSGRAAGALAALWLSISLEGLPLAAATGALLGLRWLIAPEVERERFQGFAGALALASPLLFAATRAPGAWGQIACDAISPIHLLLFVTAGLGVLATIGTARARWTRVAGLGLTGIGCGLVYLGMAPLCRAGAFAALDPLVYYHWYLNVDEGLPLWVQTRTIVAIAISFPLVGLAGAVVWLRQSPRDEWVDRASYLALLAAACLVTVFVQRANVIANAYAIPGALILAAGVLARAQALRAAPVRVVASAAAVLAFMPTTPALLAVSVDRQLKGGTPRDIAISVCTDSSNFATVRALGPATLLSGIDIGPGLLINSDARVLASGHHRNNAGMHDVIAFFIGNEDEARKIVERRRIDYVVVCPDIFEMSDYLGESPNGLWARLVSGTGPAWLRPVRLPGSTLAVWRVLPRPVTATPSS